MSRAFAFIGAVVPALVIPGATFADTSAASACAADLPAEPKAIYDAAAPEFAAAADPRALVKAKVAVLVKAGTVQRSSARSSARAAATV